MTDAFRSAFTAEFDKWSEKTFARKFCNAEYCGSIDSPVEFARCEKQVREFARLETDKLRASLSRKHFKNLHSHEERERATVTAVTISTQSYNVIVRAWHKFAAQWYGRNAYLQTPANLELYKTEWARVPLRVLQHWAQQTISVFDSLLRNRTVLFEDLVLPYACAVKLSLRRRLVPAEDLISSWNCETNIVISDHFMTLAATMPSANLRNVLTAETWQKLIVLHGFSVEHKSNVPIASNQYYGKALEIAHSKCLPVYRQAMLDFSHHVQHEIFRMRNFMALTTDVSDIWIYWATQILESINLVLHVFGALHWNSVPENKSQLDVSDLQRMQNFDKMLNADPLPLKRPRLQDFRQADTSNVSIVINQLT